MPFVSPKRLYVNADHSKVVDEDSPEAAFLLVAKGHSLSDADARRYGLYPPESKAIKGPPENKSRR